VAYIINNTGNSNEYYILENRQQTGFGTGNGGHGLMVWHIDYNQTAWMYNSVNTDKNHQRMTFLPADGQVGELQEAEYGYYYEISPEDEAGDAYPSGSKEVQPLTWFTAEKGGTKTHQNLIHNIFETSDGKIGFTYGEYYVLPRPELEPPTITADCFIANWLPVDGATSYVLQVEAMTGEEAPSTVLSEDFSSFTNAGSDALISNSVVDRYTQTNGWKVSSLYGTKDASVRVGTTGSVGYIATPAIGNKAGTLIVEFDASYYNNDGSSVVVSILNGTQVVATQTVGLTASRATYSCTFRDVPSGCNVKFASTAAKKRFYLYNVNIMDMSGVGSKVTTYHDLTTTSYAIEPIEVEQYFYRVQAVCEEGSSEWSEWMDVDTADGIGKVPENNMLEGETLNCLSSKPDCFDLSGRLLQRAPQHGPYIRNGKTYMAR